MTPDAADRCPGRGRPVRVPADPHVVDRIREVVEAVLDACPPGTPSRELPSPRGRPRWGVGGGTEHVRVPPPKCQDSKDSPTYMNLEGVVGARATVTILSKTVIIKCIPRECLPGRPDIWEWPPLPGHRETVTSIS